ncbi:MarR family protein [Paraliobacillus sp. PM-2]|uniref:MarR family winged helix-turn-helix transcriptional regulator n=1 Tax=Paraliobacillus sp. PM-2 TaxID=1462524 RepID=UPI00061C90E4|nr:MarR family transcriptional regulator [Paraliobacillus sp. PM-2]CQR47254.1 MarR family protein [Paraliobacillus sp. PM-2]
MSKDSIESIEVEMAVLTRRITMLTAERKKAFDRSAYLLLQALANHGETGVKKLATILQLDISTVSRQAAILEQKQFITKIANPEDKRSYYYQINNNGKRTLHAYKQKRMTFFSELLANWSEKDRENFSELLEKFNKTAHAYYHKKK